MTSMIDRIGRALVIAPHPDDEVLGCGGVMALLGDRGVDTHVAIVTEGRAPAYTAAHLAQLVKETEAAHAILATTEIHYLGLPAAALDQVAHAGLNHMLASLIVELAPDTVFVPFGGDVHRDHQLVFASALVAVRPAGPTYPVRLLAYETLSETNWNAPGVTPGFTPNVFIDVAEGLERKLAAFSAYASQVRAFPSERSIEALTALARLRGACVHRTAAEAFMLLREVG
ncbi:PIG-L deacetylase family protein [Glacieibacterium sp.]|uniref:PIG-L deacetylase family protein n=1 Tax=Glacieibacterium sp. TaxID=2860237 RepID=UPI003B009077